jgi:hypothetical protein
LAGPEGIARSLQEAGLIGDDAFQPPPDDRIIAAHLAPEEHEKSARIRYPIFLVYCDRIQNLHREKFRRFSGTLRLVIEVRVSSDRSDRLQDALYAQTEAVLDVLERNRGCLGQGVFWSGNYEVDFPTLRRGGAQFLQSARVLLELEVSRD